jgi:hypothetical protein
MPLVLGIILLLSLGTVMLVQNTFEQFPIVTKDVIQHQAYRAMESGLDEYQYAVNANGNFAACDATFVNASGTVVGTTSASLDSSVICGAMSFGTWTSVPGTASSNGAPSWFLVDDPIVNISTGNVSVDVVGASGYPNDYNYQTAVVNLQPLNSFLLNVLWLNYDQIQPAVVNQYGGSASTCLYYWANNPDALSSGCENLDFISADTLTGNVFMNDSVFVCGSPSFQNIATADPDQQWVQDCSGTPNVSGTKSFGVPTQPIPTDNSSLNVQASLDGCVYEGPTTITISGSTMTVYSPGTPTGKPTGAPGTSLSNDPLNDPANTTNVCVPSTATTGSGWTGPGSVAVPANGVVYVEGCQAAYQRTSGSPSVTYCNGANYTPLSAAGETGTGGDTVGDAIIQGNVTTPMTIGSGNNIVIDGNLCYTDTLSSGNCTTTTPAAPSTNVLGLVATNYVEINHPVDSRGNNVSSCSPSNSPSSGSPTCDLSNPVIDAVVLSLQGSFLVNNFTSGSGLGTLNVYGTIDQDWRGPVGTYSGGSVVSGYAKNYQYDPRMVYLSPPYYLSPGTSQWGFASFTVAAGICKVAAGSPFASTACRSFP